MSMLAGVKERNRGLMDFTIPHTNSMREFGNWATLTI